MRRSVGVIVTASVLMLCLVGGGCVGTAQAASTEDLGGKVIFTDDFSNPSSGWATCDTSSGRVKYQNRSLIIRDYTGTASARTTSHNANCYVEDAIVEFDVTWIDGTDDNWQSIEVRNDRNGSAYGFDISADGYYGITVDINGRPQNLVGPTPSSYIRQGRNSVNSVRASAIGSTLRLYVNGHLLADETDTRLRGGTISFSVSSLDASYSEVAFSNLRVTRP